MPRPITITLVIFSPSGTSNAAWAAGVLTKDRPAAHDGGTEEAGQTGPRCPSLDAVYRIAPLKSCVSTENVRFELEKGILKQTTEDIVTHALMTWFYRKSRPGVVQCLDRNSLYVSSAVDQTLAESVMTSPLNWKSNC